MPNWPRTIVPSRISQIREGTGLRSRTESGAGQLRNRTQSGVQWQEDYPPLSPRKDADQVLLATIRHYWTRQVQLDIKHLGTPGSGLPPRGTGTSGVTVSGANQTGDSLVTTGWPASTSGVVKAGDVVKVAGITKVLWIKEDANSDGIGNATIKFWNPIFRGNAPADSASVTTTDVLFNCIILARTGMPKTKLVDRYGGITVTFQEWLP